MISSIFNTFFYEPLYNGLIFLMSSIIPWADAGVAIIIFTIIIKLALMPLSFKAVRTQLQLKEIEPDIKKLKEKHKNDKQQQATEMMSLYKEKDIKPFSGILTMFIQLPIIFALYFIFLKGGFPDVQTDILYSFVNAPDTINLMFLGAINVAQTSLVMAIIAGLSQFVSAHVSSKGKEKKEIPGRTGNKNQQTKPSFKDQLTKSMGTQMKYVFPFIVFFISYKLSAAIAIYWATSNVFQTFQEIYVKKRLSKTTTVAEIAKPHQNENVFEKHDIK